jgi:hypothetical protein
VFVALLGGSVQLTGQQRVSSPDEGTSEESLRFVYQVPASSTFEFSLAVTYHPRSSTIAALVLGLREDGILELISWLGHSKHLISAPELLPILLVEMNTRMVQGRISSAHKGLNTITHQINLDRTPSMPATRHEIANAIEEAEKDAEIVTISRDLTRISAKLAKNIYVCSSLIQICRYLQEVGQQSLVISGKSSATDRSPEHVTEVGEKIRNMLKFNIQWLESSNSRALSLTQKADAYVQTVST